MLQLPRRMAKKGRRSIRMEPKITHEELSEMVDMTRPRVSLFMQRFYHLGRIETNRKFFHYSKCRRSPKAQLREGCAGGSATDVWNDAQFKCGHAVEIHSIILALGASAGRAEIILLTHDFPIGLAAV